MATFSMGTLGTDTDLGSLFDIEMAPDLPTTPESIGATWQQIKCRKCGGGGKFIGWSGRPVGPCFACKGTGFHVAEPRNDPAIDVSKIEIAFATAHKNGVKTPKLRLGAFMFSRAPDHGKNAGSVYVKQGSEYLGKVTAGKFLATRGCGDDRQAQVIEAAANPDAAAKAYGFRTGSCSCCGRELTNAESIRLGIGPICAEKYGF